MVGTRTLVAGLVVLSILALPPLLSLADDKTRINTFYGRLVEVFSAPDSTAFIWASLVAQDRNAAEQCLAILKKRAEPSNDEGLACRALYEKLEEIFTLTGDKLTCSSETVDRFLAAARKQVGDRDKAFYLEQLVRLCPQTAAAFHSLGDIYLKERRAGMAVQAYRKGLALKDDPDTRRLLEEAQELAADYQRQPQITPEVARAFLKSNALMAPKRQVARKAVIGSALQTNRIHFDEWSCRIKEEALPQLNALGQALQEALREDPGLGLLVEGHTDKRGPLEQNLKLSQDRADAIKDYLLRTFQIEPGRLATKGYGPSLPFTPEENENAYALNRRVEFRRMDGSAR